MTAQGTSKIVHFLVRARRQRTDDCMDAEHRKRREQFL